MRTRLLQMALIAGLAMLGVRPSAQAPQAAQAELTTLDGPRIMRMVLTMQVNRPFGAAGYGTLSDVLPLIPGIAGDVTRPGTNLVQSAFGQASNSGASMRSSSAIVVAQLRIVIDLYAGVPTILPRRLFVRCALSRCE